jgi:hypothetical protein
VPAACKACFTKQRIDKPQVEPGCILEAKMDEIKALPPTKRARKLMPVIVWTRKNECPIILGQRLIGPVYREVTGRPFLPLINSRSRDLHPDLALEPHRNSHYSSGFGAYRTQYRTRLRPGTPR